MSAKVVLLDDHQIVIDGLKLLLSGTDRIEVVEDFTKAIDMFNWLKKNKADIVITDIMMPDIDGYEVAKRLNTDYPEIQIIALSMNGEGELIEKMIEEAKVSGYLLKTTDKAELLKAIEAVYDGDSYYSKEILHELSQYKRLKRENEEIHLTSREIEIIQCIAEGLVNKQIADKLFISERTVETHRKNIFRKTNIHTVLALVEFAKKRKIISS